jgi:hypothetical protein
VTSSQVQRRSEHFKRVATKIRIEVLEAHNVYGLKVVLQKASAPVKVSAVSLPSRKLTVGSAAHKTMRCLTRDRDGYVLGDEVG